MVTLVPPPDVLRAAGIAQVSGRFDRHRPRAARNIGDGTVVPPQLQGAVLSRQLEFLAGRWCARRALRAIDHVGNREVGIAPDGVPRWPSGCVGSITHTADFVWVAAASRRDVGAIGIDSEPIMPAARARRLAPCIAVPDEIGRTRDVLGLDVAVAATLLFSAKESLFKCLYAHLPRPFHHLDVCVEMSREPGSFRARLHPPLCDDLPHRLDIHGRFHLDATHVHTGVTLSAGDVLTRVERA
jgi:enterobactin synthetase component D